MSLICICVAIGDFDISEMQDVEKSLLKIAKKYDRGVSFLIDWQESIVDSLDKRSIVFSINDDSFNQNCEMLFLPDGWYFNGFTNNVPFEERMRYLLEIERFFFCRGFDIEFYIGTSGMEPNEYLHVIVEEEQFLDYLRESIGIVGVDEGLHITVK